MLYPGYVLCHALCVCIQPTIQPPLLPLTEMALLMLPGWHGLWEVAVLCSDRMLGGVWGEGAIKALLSALAATFKPAAGAREPGRFTMGACAAAALWWLLCQPKHPLMGQSAPRASRPSTRSCTEPGAALASAGGGLGEAVEGAGEGGLDGAVGSTSLARGVPQAAAASTEEGMEPDQPSAELAAAALGGALRRHKPTAMAVAGGHVGTTAVVAATPLPYMLIYGLFQSGLVKVLLACAREVAQLCVGPSGSKLMACKRLDHASLAATWIMGAAAQAMSVKFVRSTLAQACAYDLENRKKAAAASKKAADEEEAAGAAVMSFSLKSTTAGASPAHKGNKAPATSLARRTQGSDGAGAAHDSPRNTPRDPVRALAVCHACDVAVSPRSNW